MSSILNDKRYTNLLMNGGFDVWQRGATLGGTLTGDTSTGSATISALDGDGTAILRTGMTVSGAAIPSGRTVSTITSATAITINSGTSVTAATGGTLAFGVPDDTYGPDRWYALVQTNGVAMSQTTGDNARYALRLTQNAIGASANQRMGVAQIIESNDAYFMRGESVTVQARFKVSALQGVKVAVLEWTGTADSVTSDVVNSWTSTTYTAGNFFTLTSTTVVGVSDAVTPTAVNTWTDISVSGTVSSSCNNLIVVIWTPDVCATGFTLDITECGMYENATSALNWVPRPYAHELNLCKRYFERITSDDNGPFAVGYASTTSNVIAYTTYTPKRSSTPTVTFPGLIADYSVRHEESTTVATGTSDGSLRHDRGWFNVTVASGLTAGNGAVIIDSNNSTVASMEITAEL